ncbi:MAG TPA: 4Fe-4S dicluster domain-containing protein [Candidatus Ozemobacteraceae bacterium]|nr:4Fe-4S dicluster domain-containing protein [Candidatus Ozemobacteraceae bacterium]
MTDHPRCINCLACAEACPRGLFPSILFHSILQGTDEADAAAVGLLRCGMCRVCESVCPAGLPLTTLFVAARAGRARPVEKP